MVERALKSKSAVSVLNEDFNDIDVYVEDTAIEAKKIYAEIISRIYNNQFKIDNVIPLGGCSQVIKEWKSNKDKNDNRPKVFLIDGDYHFLNNSLSKFLNAEEVNNHRGLFVLPRYCIENYLIDFNSFVEIVYEEIVSDDRNVILENLKFENWINKNSEILTDLFIYNSICIHYNVETKTSKFKYTNLQSSTPGVCCQTRVKDRILEIKKLIHEKDSKIDIGEEFSSRKKMINENDFLLICTGKDYLYPMMKKYISNLYDRINHVSDTSLKIRLAKICDISELMEIKNNILQ